MLTIRDPRTRNINGNYGVGVEIGTDALTFELPGHGAGDAFFTATWETAPFVRRR